jgi:hypothetical protein
MPPNVITAGSRVGSGTGAGARPRAGGDGGSGHRGRLPVEELPHTPLTREEADAKTVDDRDLIVAQFAEPGAEDGAGAQISPPDAASARTPWRSVHHQRGPAGALGRG